MTDQSLPIVSYPGIIAYEEWDFTDRAGVEPACGMMRVYAQPNPPPFEGDLTMSQDGRTVVIKRMRIDKATWEAGSGGQIASVMFMDERWRWSVGYQISGIYNSRRLGSTQDTVGSATSDDNTIDPLREKTPKQLVDMLFEAMEVTNYDASLVASDPKITPDRPYCEWDISRPAQELQTLLDDWGVQLVPIRSKGIFKICRTGMGDDLPDTYQGQIIPFEDPSQGIDPKETPNGVTAYGAPIRYQFRIQLEACGKEIWDVSKQPTTIPKDPNAPRPLNNADGSIKAIDNLTYTPFIPNSAGLKTWIYDASYGCQNVSRDRVRQPDGTYIAPFNLATQYVGKLFRPIEDAQGFIEVPGYVDFVTATNKVRRRQLILTDVLAIKYTNSDGVETPAPAFCDFIGQHDLWLGANDSTAGTRLDLNTVDGNLPDQTVTFTINSESQTVSFSHVLRTSNSNLATYPLASVWLTCAVMVRDPVTWQPVRYSKMKPVPGTKANSVGKFVMPLLHDDIQKTFQATYEAILFDGTAVPSKVISNSSYCDPFADYYIDSMIESFDTPKSLTRNYIGMWPIDMDGAINQVSYLISTNSADTRASRGTEHDTRFPRYREMQRRIAVNKAAEDAEKVNANPFKDKVA